MALFGGWIKFYKNPNQLSDISKANVTKFQFQAFDCHEFHIRIWLVVANHVLFYCEDIASACKEIVRVLTPGGRFICSTYGINHMKEISDLVQKFDNRIVLSAEKLYEQFSWKW